MATTRKWTARIMFGPPHRTTHTARATELPLARTMRDTGDAAVREAMEYLRTSGGKLTEARVYLYKYTKRSGVVQDRQYAYVWTDGPDIHVQK